ncbi:MAG: asparaginase [Firmicutes bacterium]|nr:asparaginase [Bacillota bacterium]
MALLLEERRAAVVDNTHYGHVAVVDSQGNILHSCGDPFFLAYGRSALKPMQVLPLLETGAADHFSLTDEEIVLCAASHSAKDKQRELILQMLEKTGRSLQDLICGATPPPNPSDHDDIIRKEGELNRLCNCCSGVHAGMIATAVYCNESVHGYEDIEHPVQQRVFEAVCDVTHYPKARVNIGIDGCGIPTYAMPLAYMAWGFARLTKPELFTKKRGHAVERIVEAMVRYPEMIVEEDCYNTHLIRALHGRVLAKEGAKGLFGFCDRERNIGVAFKIEDGNKECIPTITNELLRQLSIGTEQEQSALATYDRQDIVNTCQDAVGFMNPVFQLSAYEGATRCLLDV